MTIVHRTIRTGLVLHVLLGVSAVASAGLPVSFPQDAKLIPADSASWDQFGNSVAVRGDVAVVGSYLDDDNGGASGSAYVFRFDGADWVQEQKLIAPNGVTADLFGSAVAIGDGVILVGAPENDVAGFNAGTAYGYRYIESLGSWIHDTTLLPQDASPGQHFGDAIAIDGDYAVIGAYFDNEIAIGSGAAYIFQRIGSTWIQVSKLKADDPAALDFFGFSVAISGDRILVGSYEADALGPNSGAAYFFQRLPGAGVWEQSQKVVASDGQPQDKFGVSVAMRGTAAVIGAYWDDDAGFDSGSAYVYRHTSSEWLEVDKLVPEAGSAGSHFGYAVSIDHGMIMVGAPEDDELAGEQVGSSYLFQKVAGNWREALKILAADGAAGDFMGRSVAVEGGLALAGAIGHDAVGPNAGAAYVFELSTNAGCFDADLDGNGFVNIDDLVLAVIEFGNPGPVFDVNGDGALNIDDLVEIVLLWGPCE